MLYDKNIAFSSILFKWFYTANSNDNKIFGD